VVDELRANIKANLGDDGPRRAFRPYHALAVPKGPQPLGSTDAAASGSGEHCQTTAMLRNIPNKYTQNSLLEEIDSAGFAKAYDFFYLPMDIHNRANVGYAFINFLRPSDLESFSRVFTDYVFQKHSSLKIARVSPAHIQGLEENLRHFSNRAVTWARNSQYRPIVLLQGRHRDLGELITEFPGGGADGRDSAALIAAASSSAAVRPQAWLNADAKGHGFNPDAKAFVPSAAVNSDLRADAQIFVPRPRERETARSAFPPGFSGGSEFPLGVLGIGGALLPLPCDAEASPLEALKMRSGLKAAPAKVEVVDAGEQSFTLAKAELERTLSNWLDQEFKAADDAESPDGSSTRSNSSNSESARDLTPLQTPWLSQLSS